jgi:hypothetical protein
MNKQTDNTLWYHWVLIVVFAFLLSPFGAITIVELANLNMSHGIFIVACQLTIFALLFIFTNGGE